MRLKLHGIAEELEQAIYHLTDREAKIRMLEDVLHELLNPLEQHIGCMEEATQRVNRHIANKWIERRLEWI